MNPIVILLPAFLISLVALAVFIWSMHRGAFGRDTVGARVIFTAHEVGHIEEPAAPSASRAALQSLVMCYCNFHSPQKECGK
jgi:cytochrome c oxidase cbb3-type subunit I